MKNRVSECLKAAGISKVVWVDDHFASPTRNELETDILKAVRVLKERGDSSAELAIFGKVDLTQSRQQVEDSTVAICEPLSDGQLKEILATLSVATGTAVIAPQPDLSDEDFRQLESALGRGLRKFSWDTWTSTGITEFGASGEDTLFLVDKEFSRESTSSDGIDLLDFLVKNTRGLCILLTHTCQAKDQDQRRTEFAVAKGLLPHSFCVVSKQQTVELSVDERFAAAIRTVVMHKFNGQIAYAISETIQKSAKDVALELTKQSASVLDRVVFKSSIEEGVMEYDVVMRIFNIQQRYALNRALQEPGIQRDLRSARKFRKGTAALGPIRDQADMTFFREWRQREMFLDGAGLNALHFPLACGDVFECGDGKRYLLLAQPCDLVVRDDGKRNAEVGLMVLLDEVPDKIMKERSGDAPDYRFFELKGVFGSGKKWFADFKNLFVADLFVLDFTVFNADGSVRLQRDHPDPAIVLTLGWTKRLNKAKARIFPGNLPTLSSKIGMGKHVESLAADTTDGLSYPLRRIGRLESNLATAILAAWATFQTRAALGHDFTKEKTEGRVMANAIDAEPGVVESDSAAKVEEPIG